MKKKIILPLLIAASCIGFAQENTKIDSKKVRILNSSPLFLFAGESPDTTTIISQDEHYDFNCLKTVNVYSSDEYNAEVLWSLKANRENCGKEFIVTTEDVL